MEKKPEQRQTEEGQLAMSSLRQEAFRFMEVENDQTVARITHYFIHYIPFDCADHTELKLLICQ